jgi:transcriptional regulator with XRE-family HTH domain
LNEILRRALLQAQLSEDDVAAVLAVDPKTVRRWTEGRVPYLRHRWELARLLGHAEADLWPQASTGRARPAEVRAVYPHRNAVPGDVWLCLFRSAQRKICILDTSCSFIVGQPTIMAALEERARAGISMRICVVDTNLFNEAAGDILSSPLHESLLENSSVEVRRHTATLNGILYIIDDDILVTQFVYGIPAGRSPVLHIHRTVKSELIMTYLESFEQIWADAHHRKG